MKSGILIMDKQAGMTSFDVIARVRALTGQRKIGHGGTLDPMATGVLPLFLGAATKAQDLCDDKRKRYTATVRLGCKTDTGDVTGTVKENKPVGCTQRELEEAIQSFIGVSRQLPPMYSAVKVGGRRLYTLARKGMEIERTPREIEIHQIDILNMDLSGRTMTLDVLCSAGTYIRTLCEDIAERAGTLACLGALRRTLSNTFAINDALTLEAVGQAVECGRLEDLLIPVSSLFCNLPIVRLEEDQARMFRDGRVLECSRIRDLPESHGRVAVWQASQMLGLGRAEDGLFKKTWHYPVEDNDT